MRSTRRISIATLTFIAAIGVVITASGSVEPEDQPRRAPNTLQDIATAFAPFAPLPPDQELHVVVDVETYGPHDSAIDSWTYDVWRRWDEQGNLHEGIVVQGPEGDAITHIVLNGDTRTMGWGPESAIEVFDVPLEYGVWRRLVSGPLTQAATADDLEISRDGQDIEVLYSWVDRAAEELNYVSRARIRIDPETNRIEQLTWLIDRPEHEPYPVRRFTFREIKVLPQGASPDTTYQPTITN